MMLLILWLVINGCFFSFFLIEKNRTVDSFSLSKALPAAQCVKHQLLWWVGWPWAGRGRRELRVGGRWQ